MQWHELDNLLGGLMKKIAAALILAVGALVVSVFIAGTSPDTVYGQVSNPVIIPASPPGSCTAGIPLWSVYSTGTLYVCNNGTPTAVGGGTGTVTSIATTSPITGGTITTTGTIGCATCVTSRAGIDCSGELLPRHGSRNCVGRARSAPDCGAVGQPLVVEREISRRRPRTWRRADL